ncbi:hypothetical protein D3C75_1109760 [compost metagenome]
MLRQQGIFCFAIIRKLLVEQAERLTQRLFAPHPEPEPVKQPVPQGTQGIDQQRCPNRHIPREAQGKDGGNQRGGQQSRMQRA